MIVIHLSFSYKLSAIFFKIKNEFYFRKYLGFKIIMKFFSLILLYLLKPHD